MSLSARIAVEPSRRLTFVSGALSTAGVVVAATTLVARWPAAGLWFASFGLATIVVIAVVMRRAGRREAPCVLSVAGRPEIELQGGDDGGGPCRLIDSTMSWPGFSMLVLRREDLARTVHLPVFDRDLTVADRRSLGRFLAWSLRGGGATGAGFEAR